jgi:DNA-binding transcriptional LysR family regulator
MDWNLRELRFLVTAAELGTFTDAAAELHVSQAAVSRTIAALERAVGEQLLRRTARGCEPTPSGGQVLEAAKRLLGEAKRFDESVRNRDRTLRLGYAWACLGKHTAVLQRTWKARVEGEEGIALRLTRQATTTSGLAEGWCDVAVMRTPLHDDRFESVVVGLEKRVVAFAADDPQWARRRSLTLDEVAQRRVATDRRTGTTDEGLWAGRERTPEMVVQTGDVEEWLDSIQAQEAVGITAEATAHHHRRPGVVYKPLKDGPRISVKLAWAKASPPPGLQQLISMVSDFYAAG